MVAGCIGLVTLIVSRAGLGRHSGEDESIGLSRPAI